MPGRLPEAKECLQKATQLASVDPARAGAVYDKLVKEKLAKGYTPAESGVLYQCSEMAGRATGILPQLLNPIDETEALRLLSDPKRAALPLSYPS